jgi:hypothetical protein
LENENWELHQTYDLMSEIPSNQISGDLLSKGVGQGELEEVVAPSFKGL